MIDDIYKIGQREREREKKAGIKRKELMTITYNRCCLLNYVTILFGMEKDEKKEKNKARNE